MEPQGQSQAVGRRKESVARVRLFKGHGQMTVNGKPIAEYFTGEVSQKRYMKPFELLSITGQFTGTIKVLGGGVHSQLDAVIHGLARALSLMDKENFRPTLKTAGFLTRDARVRERRKYGLAHKARAKKQSPKR